jgi:hypothetical protein
MVVVFGAALADLLGFMDSHVSNNFVNAPLGSEERVQNALAPCPLRGVTSRDEILICFSARRSQRARGLAPLCDGAHPGKSVRALMKQRVAANRYADDGCSLEGLKSMWRRLIAALGKQGELPI